MLSKRPSINSLIHFYKRCVSARPRILSLSFIQDQWRSTKQMKQSRGRKELGLKIISSCCSSKIFEKTRIQRLAVCRLQEPVAAVSFLYPDGFWSHHFVPGLILPRTGHRLSKRPSNNSLIHFYKRCVSMALSFSIVHTIYSGSKKVHWTDETENNWNWKMFQVVALQNYLRRLAFKD